ncbi:HotDog domain-containing protein [Coniella lustricola]|uniref:HotDog domain-containing protein n=1 Tax=Coniella lustricola TaxID=2025994 RepID=A0A2T2ZZY9_9PEZI|nr:HotDog domain-containing protein [Coniella lustricola]
MGGSLDRPLRLEDEIDHFKSIPWCAKHLEAPNLVVTPGFSRDPRAQEPLFCETLRTKDTIAAFVCFYPRPESELDFLPELKAFVTLGNLVGGYPGVCHGGLVATLLDETLSFLGPRHRWLQSRDKLNHDMLKAYLHTDYLQPVKIPGTFLITARLTKKNGRKSYMQGVMEDENGQKVAKADGLFVELPKGKM